MRLLGPLEQAQQRGGAAVHLRLDGSVLRSCCRQPLGRVIQRGGKGVRLRPDGATQLVQVGSQGLHFGECDRRQA